jgi:uncharacterized membrane protein YkoI
MKAAALLAGGAAAGIIGAWALNSNAAPTSSAAAPTTSTSSTSSVVPGTPDADNDGDHHGGPGDGHNPDENSVTAAQAATLKAAALQHVPGGTVDRVEADSGDAAYEVHMTNASGNQVTVKFDKNLAFVAVEDGMGK